MGKERRRYSAEFKKAAVDRMATYDNVKALADELSIRRKFLYQWRDQLRRLGVAALARGPGRPKGPTKKAGKPPAAVINPDQARIAELERLLGCKQLEVDFFMQAFEHVRGATASNTTSGAKRSTAPFMRSSRSKAD